eukprot:TRINITY_DN49222_c0_g1_i1.p1 TRINITY_DN49222_c0_g1~~TRINITY_DN49222_c0_g1_i1.p1  ORF type:complete len:485 (-),score=74.37 TRINITY_DN49222_c0_g1_i1:43-1497(-)
MAEEEQLDERDLRSRLLEVPRFFRKRLLRTCPDESQDAGKATTGEMLGTTTEASTEERDKQEQIRDELQCIPKGIHRRLSQIFAEKSQQSSSSDVKASQATPEHPTDQLSRQKIWINRTSQEDHLPDQVLRVPRLLFKSPLRTLELQQGASQQPSLPSTQSARAPRSNSQQQESNIEIAACPISAQQESRSSRDRRDTPRENVCLESASNSTGVGTHMPSETPAHVPVDQDQPRWHKETLWVFCDDFDAMDLRDAGSIRHSDFKWALKALGEKAAHKKMVSEYFRRTTEELSIDTFMRLAFPSATCDEHVQLKLWAEQRKAWLLLTRHGFTAQNHELRRIFDLLREDKEVDHVNVEDMVSAGILTQAEMDRHIPTPGHPHPLTFVRFRRIFRATLDVKFNRCECSMQQRKQLTNRRHETCKPQLRTRADRPGPTTSAFTRLDIFKQPPTLAIPDKLPVEAIPVRLTFRDALNLRRVKWGLPELP